jgi:hypothetical protein
MAQWRHGDGVWKARGGRWAGGEVQHADSSSSLFMFSNLALEEETLAQAWRRLGQAMVMSALGLDSASWPRVFESVVFEDARLIGIPLEAGVPVAERAGDCFAIALARCSGPAVLMRGGIELCKKELKGQRWGYHRALVWQAREIDGPIFFGDLPYGAALSLAEVSSHPSLASVLFPALVSAARFRDRHAKDVAAARILEVEVFLEEMSRAGEVFEQLEHLSKKLQQSSLSLLPLQLRFTDSTEWKHGRGLCESCKKGSLLGDILQHRCSCGLVSFEIYHRGKERITPSVPAQYWAGVCARVLKEHCVQRFFSWTVLFDAIGVTIEDLDGRCASILLEDDNLAKVLQSSIARDHLFRSERKFAQFSFGQARLAISVGAVAGRHVRGQLRSFA